MPASSLVHVAADGRVHVAQAFGRVQDQQRDVRAIDRLSRKDDADVVDVLLQETRLPDARGVHEQVAVPVAHQQAVHRVARRARDRRDHRALLAQEPVQQRGLANVGPADEGDPDRRFFVFRLLDPWDLRQGGVEQIADAPAVLGRDRVHLLEPERRELGEAVGVALDLVDGDQHLLALLPQAGRDGPVVGQQPRAAVDDEDHEVRFADREVRLDRRGPQQRIVRTQEETAGVDELERGALPRGLGVVAVAGRAGTAVGDGLAPAADPVEQRGLADIGPPDERDLGYGDHVLGSV